MAYGRYDNRSEWREPRQRSDERFEDRAPSRAYRGAYDRSPERGYDDDRGFLDRAGDEIASWFGDDEAEQRRRMDARRDRSDDEGYIRSRASGLMSDRDYDRYSREPRFRDEGYRRPYTGRMGGRGFQERWDRGGSPGSMAAGIHDPHYDALRRRQMDELDRDYHDYRRENQSRFESDFSNWREQRMSKRQMLGQVREHMEVVGSDGEHVGTVDRASGDRIILAKSDSDDGRHHSLSCSALDRVEENRVMLNCPAAEAKAQWRDDIRDRALFEREDQGEAGPGILERSFSGTY